MTSGTATFMIVAVNIVATDPMATVAVVRIRRATEMFQVSALWLWDDNFHLHHHAWAERFALHRINADLDGHSLRNFGKIATGIWIRKQRKLTGSRLPTRKTLPKKVHLGAHQRYVHRGVNNHVTYRFRTLVSTQTFFGL